MNQNEQRSAKKKQPNYVLWVFAVVVIAAIGWYAKGAINKKKALDSIAGQTDLVEWYERALTREQQILQEPSNFEFYNGAFFNWKTLGDATGEKYFYEKALKVVNKAQKQEESRSALFYVNAANIHITLGEFKKADELYAEAVALNPGDERMWIPYLNLWQQWEEKTPQEVIELYDKALGVLVAKVNVTIAKAAYLREIGDYQQSLAIYEAIAVAVPEHQGIAEKIQELRYLMTL